MATDTPHSRTPDPAGPLSPEPVLPDSMIGRVALILDQFGSQSRSIGVSELARRTGLPKASVSRIASELAQYQFLEPDHSGYRLGLKVFELGSRSVRPQFLRRTALAAMADLRRATGHTIHLAVLEQTEVVYLEILRGPSAVRMPSRVGNRMPAHATAVGKALLAFSAEEIIEGVTRQPLRAKGPHTITAEQDLRVELESIRTNGVSYEQEESGTNIACAACPILLPDDSPIAAISVAGPVGAINLSTAGAAVQTATLGISRQLRMSSASLIRLR